MYKVLIVDDEILFREYLRTVLNWESFGFVICGEAKNGQEALLKASETRPDLALVDINMPIMDGIDLSTELKEKYPNMAIVMVTGYSEFEYARRALKLGVEDYILKPFNPEELFLTLVKIKSQLQKLSEDRKVHKDQLHWLREQFLNMLISQDLTLKDDELVTQFERFGISPSSDPYVVITIEIDNLYQKWDSNQEIQLWKSTISNILSEILTWKGHNLVFFGPEDRIISIAQIDLGETCASMMETESLKRLCDMVKRHFKFTVTVGIGRSHDGFTGIRESYMEALTALQSKLTAGNGTVIEYQDTDLTKQGFYSSVVNEKMMLALRMNDHAELKKHLDDVFQYIREQRLTPDMTYVIVMGLVSLCLSHIVANGQDIVSVLGAGFAPYQEMKRQENLEKTYSWIEEIMSKTLKSNEEGNRTSRSKRIFNEAKLLIEQNYQDPNLSIETITRLVFVNGSYLRKIFNKEAEMSISDYLTQVRMHKAKELIIQKTHTIMTISEKVGYNDPGYFSKCFKKYFGLSPSEVDVMNG
ncbi:response regulator [Paenibacillus sp. N3.4]|uniref:response regulator transcription factor n=1 Tax=Paenibacillus sp. N3.4 TaxID=2603222 RepID=UPI0011C6F66F|nr:response regulator [Paenibacillus sp. N3.4]TXK80381.1 response regulator [Paenibacillus sp. N3.4]